MGQEWGDPPPVEDEAFDLIRMQLRVDTSPAHPEGVCTTEHMTCASCRMPAWIAFRFGGPMAYCRLCCFAWAVDHDPVGCWQDVAALPRLTLLSPCGQGSWPAQDASSRHP